ncbi:MAG: EamA family transporter [Deltaproteobacteria bacterium]|nr:EamA family transporter [Deltaproteobacteria bacterium]
MVASAAAFTVMTTLIREAAPDVHPFEIAFFRALVNLVLMIPFAIRAGGVGLKTNNHKVFALRGVCGLGFLMTYFSGAALIPVAESQALIFTSPLWGALLAVLFLGERVNRVRALALIAGFAGVLIILRPGLVQISFGALLVLAGALAAAASNTIVKFTTRTDHPDAIVFYQMVYVTPMIAVPALWVWTWPNLEQLLLMFGVGFFATLNQRFLSRAYAAADATAVLPFEFARLPVAAVIGFLAFRELPDIWAWVGGAVIFSASLYMVRRETRAARRDAGLIGNSCS